MIPISIENLKKPEISNISFKENTYFYRLQ